MEKDTIERIKCPGDCFSCEYRKSGLIDDELICASRINMGRTKALDAKLSKLLLMMESKETEKSEKKYQIRVEESAVEEEEDYPNEEMEEENDKV